MNIEKYVKMLKEIYSIYPEYVEIINNMLKSEIELLYFLDNKNLEVNIIKNEINEKNVISVKKIKYDKKLFDTILYLYIDYLKDEEKELLKNKNDVFVVVKKIVVEKNSKFNNNRKNIILTSFFHKKTNEYLLRLDISRDVIDKKTNFFYIKKILNNKFKPIYSHGILIDGSINMFANNIRKNNDIDLVILHPYNKSPNVKRDLENLSKIGFLDAYFDGVVEWEGENKEFLDKNTSEITNNKINSYFEMIFNPNNYYYFYGIKIIDFDYDLKYRVIRSYPKNIAEIVMINDIYNIKMEINKKLIEPIKVNEKNYSLNKFLKISYNYYKKYSKKIKYNNIDEYKNKLKLLNLI